MKPVAGDQHVASLAVVGFLDRDYSYKSVYTQIPHDGLAPIPYTGQKSSPTGYRTSTVSRYINSKQRKPRSYGTKMK